MVEKNNKEKSNNMKKQYEALKMTFCTFMATDVIRTSSAIADEAQGEVGFSLKWIGGAK